MCPGETSGARKPVPITPSQFTHALSQHRKRLCWQMLWAVHSELGLLLNLYLTHHSEA